MTTGRRRSTAFRALASLMACTIASGAFAQQPYFRYTTPGGTASNGGEVVTPPGEVENPAEQPKMTFGDGSIAPFTVRAIVGEPFSLEFGTVGGTNPISWLSPPPLPSGIQFDQGILFGNVSAPHSGTSVFEAQDATGASARGRVTFVIVNAAVSLSRFKPLVRVGARYAADVTSNVRDAAYSTSGAPGAVVSGESLTGIASTPGTFPLSVSVGRPGTQISATTTHEVTVALRPEIEFVPPSIPAMPGPVDVQVIARHVIGSGSPRLTSSQSAFHARGLSYSAGRIVGNLSPGAALDARFALDDSADDASATATFAIPLLSSQPATIVWDDQIRPGDSLTASPGNPAPATIATTIPSPVCTVTRPIEGVAVSSSCQISGAPVAPGEYLLEVSIVPGANPSETPIVVSAPLTVLPSLVASTPNPNPRPAVGESLSIVPSTSGIVGEPTFSLVGTTPEALEEIGLVFDPTTGRIDGVPEPGTSTSIVIEVTDSQDGAKARLSFTVVVAQANVVSGVSTVNMRSGQTRTFTATSNIPNAVFSLVDAPEYITIDPATGVITYAAPVVSELVAIPGYAVRATHPERPGLFRQTVALTPGNVRPPMSIAVEPTVSGRGNVAMSIPFSFVNVERPEAIEIRSGTLPTGLTLGANAISGTPTVPGTSSFVLRVRDGVDNNTASESIEITVTPSLTFALTGPVTPVGKGGVGQPFSVVATPENALGTVTFSNVVISGRPASLSTAGLSITPEGRIEGTPSASLSGIANIRMTEVHEGRTTTIDRPLTVAINAEATAAHFYPVATFAGADVSATLYDDSSSTSITTGVGERAYVEFQFSEPVTVNGLTTNSGSTWSVRNVDTGQSFSVPAGTARAFTASTGANWRVSGGNGISLTTMRLLFGGVAPIAPSFTVPSAGSYQLTGNAFSNLPANVKDAVEPVTWSTTSPLPAGISLDPDTGAITGAATEMGEFTIVRNLTDARGISAVQASISMSIFSGVTVADKIPVSISISGSDLTSDHIRAALYDEDDSTSVLFPANETMTITYDEPVTAGRVFLSRIGSGTYNGFTLRAADTDTGVTGGNSDSYSFSPRPATSAVWVVTNRTNTGTFGGFRLGFGGNSSTGARILPSLSYLTTTYNTYTGQTVSSVTPSGSNGNTGLDSVFEIFDGQLPEGFSLDPLTGVVTASPTVTGEHTFQVVKRLSNGVRSVARTITWNVHPSKTVDAFLPVIEGPGISDEDDRAKLYDDDVDTVVQMPGNATWTFTYPEDVSVTRLSYGVVAAGSVTIRNVTKGDAIITNALSMTINTTRTTSNAFTVASGRVFSVTNRSSTPINFRRLALTATTTPAAQVTVPSIALTGLTSGTPTLQGILRTASVSLTPTVSDASGILTWEASGVPTGMSQDATGVISGQPTTEGIYDLRMRVTDGRGYASAYKNLRLSVLPAETAQNTAPSISGIGDTASTTAALLDRNTATAIILPAGGVLTFTYPTPVAVSRLRLDFATGAKTLIFADQSGQQLSRTTSTTGGASLSFGSQGISVISPVSESNVVVGSVFTLTNTGTTSVSLDGAVPQFQLNGSPPYP